MTRMFGLADEKEKKPCVTRYSFLIVSTAVAVGVNLVSRHLLVMSELCQDGVWIEQQLKPCTAS